MFIILIFISIICLITGAMMLFSAKNKFGSIFFLIIGILFLGVPVAIFWFRAC